MTHDLDATGMKWNAAHTSVGQDWGTGPTLAEGVPLGVSLSVDGRRKVFALNETGAESHPIAAAYGNGHLRFTVGSRDHTLWHAIIKAEGRPEVVKK